MPTTEPTAAANTAQTPLQHLDRAVAAIVEAAQPLAVVLFGSAAKGTATWDSDLDLLVVREFSGPEERTAVRRQLERAMMKVDTPVDLILKTPAEVERGRNSWIGVVYDAVREGRVVHGSLRMERGDERV